MKLSDYIVTFLQKKGIRHFFGYQGTMIAHLVDSIERNPETENHSGYNEQGAAFAACGYAQAKEECACAYATSGPGAINLLSGVADAYYDSLPVIFLTGQLNTYEYSGIKGLRQQGFQETDIVAMAKPITKYAVQIRNPEDIVEELNKAYHIATTGRRGPVLIDLPMNIQRSEVENPVYDMTFEDKHTDAAAAQQAAELSSKEVHVIPTKNVAMGIAAAVAFQPDMNGEEKAQRMAEAAQRVKTGTVTYAVRDSEWNGVHISAGDIIGLHNGAIEYSGNNVHDVVMEMMKAIVTDEDELITVYYGADTKQEDAEAITAEIQDTYGNCDVECHMGGQPLYYYLISVE